MKIQNLFLFLLLALSITVVSCGDDEEEIPEGCMLCTLEVDLLADCDYTICDDGSQSSVGGTASCTTGDAALALLDDDATTADRIAALESVGFTCRN